MKLGQSLREVAAGKVEIWRREERKMETWTAKVGQVRWRGRWLREKDEWTVREEWERFTQCIAKGERGRVEVAKVMRQWWDGTSLCGNTAVTRRKSLADAGAPGPKRILP
jgi:hypothetical protein